MKSILYSEDLEHGGNVEFTVMFPESCPHCGKAIAPKVLSGKHILRHIRNGGTITLKARLYVSFLCVSCENVFVSEYQTASYEGNDEFDPLNSEYTAPTYHSNPIHSPKINELSPKFVKIYNESHYAEESGLTEICGMGYRKALEFLVKDYAIMQHPDDREDIESKMLSKCIEKYIDNAKLKALAQASAWIGNDQTHYVMRNPNYNVDHLKAFIAAAESYINSELEVIEAQKFISSAN